LAQERDTLALATTSTLSSSFTDPSTASCYHTFKMPAKVGNCAKCGELCELTNRSHLCHECVGACVRHVCSSARELHIRGDRPDDFARSPATWQTCEKDLRELLQRESAAGSRPSGPRTCGPGEQVRGPVNEQEDFCDELAPEDSCVFSEAQSRETSLSSISSIDSESAFREACDYFAELAKRHLPRCAEAYDEVSM